MTNKEKAIELLGEIKYETSTSHEIAGTSGYIQMHSKAVDVVVGLLERIKELEKSKLTREEFRSIACEYCPSIAKDSGQPEWCQGELDELWEGLTKGHWLYINRDRQIEKLKQQLQSLKDRASDEIIEAMCNKLFEFKMEFNPNGGGGANYCPVFNFSNLAKALSKKIIGGE